MTRSEGKEQKQNKPPKQNKPQQQQKSHSQQCGELEILQNGSELTAAVLTAVLKLC